MTIPTALLEAVYFRPWLISARAHAAMRMKLDAVMEGRRIDFLDMEFEQPGTVVEDGIAIVPIKGAIGRGFSGWDKVELILGEAVDAEVVAGEVLAAAFDDSVDAILLDIDSPGGMVNGTPELGVAVVEAGKRKPTYAFTAGMMASAAYWVGAAVTHGLVAAPSADVGSIGVYAMHMDLTGWLEKQGAKAEMYASGIYKGMGHPYIQLTDRQRELMQAEVNSLNEQFRAWVNKHRPDVQVEDMEGQTFTGDEAFARGMVNMTAQNIGEVKDYILAAREKKLLTSKL